VTWRRDAHVPTALIPRLFGSPGGSDPGTGELARRAAAAHAGLLTRACVRAGPAFGRPLAAILTFLGGPARAAQKRRLLCHPLLVEGLHSLAPFSAELRRWHDHVTAPPAAVPVVPAARASLGNVALVALLRVNRHWQGEQDCCTDEFGRVGFPLSDWGLTLCTDRHDVLTRQAVTLSLGRERASWRLTDTGEPVLVTSREDCLRMVAENADPLEPRRVEFPNPRVRPRLQCACRLGHSRVRYDPVAFPDRRAHAGLTGGLVERLVAALRRNSPAVYREFRTFIHAVRGFELPACSHGVVGSFSDPTVPGVMGLNIPYAPHDEPCADPLCFTWFGHELGHTKDYLIDTVLHERGVALVRNPGERVGPIPRYGRALPVRTLFQIPYVHLYEWAVLMDFAEAGFRGLPWPAPEDVAAAGEDLAAEIREAFELIRERAWLTGAGAAALAHFRELYAAASARWNSGHH
jgi:hypothetical protein